MRFILMMHAPSEGWTDAGIGTWAPEDAEAHMAFMHTFNAALRDEGVRVDAQGLDPDTSTPCSCAAPSRGRP